MWCSSRFYFRPFYYFYCISTIYAMFHKFWILFFSRTIPIYFSRIKIKTFWKKTMNDELLKLTGWYLANKLSISYSKSKFMIFKPRQKNLDCDVRFEINNCPIERVRETIFSEWFSMNTLTGKHIFQMSRGKLLSQ